MRALFTARDAVQQTTELLILLRSEGYSFRQQCRDSECTSCSANAGARQRAEDLLTLLSVAKTELQEEIDLATPHVRRRAKTKGK